MDNTNITVGKWQEWMSKLYREADWKSKLLGEWEPSNDYVHSREKVSGMLERGEISKAEAERMVRLRYRLNRRGERVIGEREKDND